jgi:hypothetical protein
MNFLAFKNAIAAQFQRMQATGKLYVVSHMQTIPGAVPDGDGNIPKQDTIKQKLTELYQKAFPVGSNDVFRQRPTHDCNCCASFIRTVGNVVAIIDGKIETIWDVVVEGEPVYTEVAGVMASYVRGRPIDDLFLHYLPYAGVDTNRDNLADITWDHFYTKIDSRFVMEEKKIGAYLSHRRGVRESYLNGLRQIDGEAIDTVLDLLANGSLYRGDEKEGNLLKFKELVEGFRETDDTNFMLYVLNTVDTVHESIAKMRGTSMGKPPPLVVNRPRPGRSRAGLRGDGGAG